MRPSKVSPDAAAGETSATFRTRQRKLSEAQKHSQRERSGIATLEEGGGPKPHCCWDETDDGVPPFCRADPPACWMLFNHAHPVTNHNRCCWVFGNVGLKHFDKHRRVYMAFAMWSTVLAMVATTYGCFALSTDPRIVRATHWSYARGTNVTSGETFKVWFGLRSAVIEEISADGRARPEETLHFGNPPPFAHATGTSGNPLVDQMLAGCRDAAVGNQIGALLSCATLLFALIGTINRMRYSSDANVQKTLGMFTDSYGAISLTYTLVNFSTQCKGPGRVGLIEADYFQGPGWICYMVCAASGLVRAAMHWLTPVRAAASARAPLSRSLARARARPSPPHPLAAVMTPPSFPLRRFPGSAQARAHSGCRPRSSRPSTRTATASSTPKTSSTWCTR